MDKQEREEINNMKLSLLNAFHKIKMLELKVQQFEKGSNFEGEKK